MSATLRNENRKRRTDDDYSTPLWCIESISKEINWDYINTILEPCSGNGSITSYIKQQFDDIQIKENEIKSGSDYFSSNYRGIDLVLTNPPYSLAKEFLQKSLTEAKTIIYLLRLGFLASKDRQEFLKLNRPTHLFVLSKRPSFVDVCTDTNFTLSDKESYYKKNCGRTYSKEDKITKCECGNKVRSGTDASEYGWIVWSKDLRMINKNPGIYFI